MGTSRRLPPWGTLAAVAGEALDEGLKPWPPRAGAERIGVVFSLVPDGGVRKVLRSPCRTRRPCRAALHGCERTLP